jgi:hypothetical protein
VVAELLLGSVLASAAGGAVFLVKYHKKERLLLENEKRERIASFSETLVREIRGRRLSEFSFPEFVDRCQVPREEADEAAADFYRKLCRKVWADGVVTDDERKKLNSLARALDIEQQAVTAIEQAAAAAVYHEAVVDVLADGVVTPEEAAELESLRKSLGLSSKESLSIAGEVSCDAYVETLRRIVRGGPVTQQAKDELLRLKRALAISDATAYEKIRSEAIELFRQCFTMAVQDGVVTLDEKETLRWLQIETGLPDSDVETYWGRLRKVEQLARCRDGHLPTVTTRKLLEGGEICHWEGECHLTYRTQKSSQFSKGELLVTSKAVIFSSQTKSFTYSPAKILDIALRGTSVNIAVSSRQGTGFYSVDDPVELEAVLTGIVRKHKYLLAEKLTSSRSRHIPDDVKRAVWYRDGGRCVKCSAAEYIEFDHIIPHARGGANTEGNIQILCRRCNLEKSDRI